MTTAITGVIGSVDITGEHSQSPARLAGARVLGLQSDARLVALARAGHDAGFEAIVRRYEGPLTRYCTRLVGAHRAQDAVQQAFISAHRGLVGASDRRIDLRPWLYRIAHNSALNVLRGEQPVSSLDSLDASSVAVASSDDEAESRARFRATLAAIDALPQHQRDALLLRELEGRSHEEIARTLGVSPGAARQHLMRGRAAVRAIVTAITPYPLAAKLAAGLATGGAVESAATAFGGAGVSAVALKVGASVLATGALLGGAVAGPPHRRHHTPQAQPPRTSLARSFSDRAGDVHREDRREDRGGEDHGGGGEDRGGRRAGRKGGGRRRGRDGSSGRGGHGSDD